MECGTDASPDYVEKLGGHSTRMREQEIRAVVVLVSILAPVYARYSSFHQRFGC
jgi:hypothetical protein